MPPAMRTKIMMTTIISKSVKPPLRVGVIVF
jgi:hypothetical protein